MPTHGDPDSNLTSSQRNAVESAAQALACVMDDSAGTAAFEDLALALVMGTGRRLMQGHLEGLSEPRAFTENGQVWRVACRDAKKFMTVFGWVKVVRTLVRSERNGPTRCLVSERAGLFDDKWTPRAAKSAALATAELPFGRAESLLRQLGGMAPSATLLQRLDRHLLKLWDADRERNEERLRRACPIPDTAVTAVVSLDGVMVSMVGADRAKKRAKARKEGRKLTGPTGYKEAAVGVVTLHDVAGTRLATWRMARMPETNQTTIKAWLKAELRWIREKVPGIRVVAAADGASTNWAFLQTLGPDVEVVDYFHTVEHLTHELSKLHGAWTADAALELQEAKRLLLETKTGPQRVAARLKRMRKKTRKPGAKELRAGDKRKLTYFDHHRHRMNYAALRAEHVNIGTGVTEGTCRHLVVDRLRRSGMSWSEPGGQAVMNLRALVVSERFDEGWACFVEANSRRLKRAA